jgi:hypothetical protein
MCCAQRIEKNRLRGGVHGYGGGRVLNENVVSLDVEEGVLGEVRSRVTVVVQVYKVGLDSVLEKGFRIQA